MRILGEQIMVASPENLEAPFWVFQRKRGWLEVSEVQMQPWPDPTTPSTEPTILVLATPYLDDQEQEVTELEFPPSGGQVLAALPTVGEVTPPAEQTFHTVWRDAETGEYVTEEYALEHPDTTVSEQVPD